MAREGLGRANRVSFSGGELGPSGWESGQGGNLGLGPLVLAGEWAQGHEGLDLTNVRYLPGGWRSQKSRTGLCFPAGQPSARPQLLAPTPSTSLTYSSSRAGRPS